MRPAAGGSPGGNGGQAEDAPVIKLVSRIITRAINSGASDIHFEPEERMMRVRTRVDGILFQELLIPKAMQSAVCTRDENSGRPGCGRDARSAGWTGHDLVGGRQVNLRVSSLPTSYGENIVARILDPSVQILNLPTLGFLPDTEKQFREVVNKPYGVVLVTGPTGSGKTTTLYAVLQEVSTIDVSTFTLEDPIEYRMSLVRQTQIKDEIGLTLQHRPARLAAAGPGHYPGGRNARHGNGPTDGPGGADRSPGLFHPAHERRGERHSAPGRYGRGTVSAAVQLAGGAGTTPGSEDLQALQRGGAANRKKCWKAWELPPPSGRTRWCSLARTGCPECKHTGYKGRIGIYELMTIDERFHDPIVARSGAQEYSRLAGRKECGRCWKTG